MTTVLVIGEVSETIKKSLDRQLTNYTVIFKTDAAKDTQDRVAAAIDAAREGQVLICADQTLTALLNDPPSVDLWSAFAASSSTLAFAPLSVNGSVIEFAADSPEDILHVIMNQHSLPALLSVPKGIAQAILPLDSYEGTLLSALICASAQGVAVEPIRNTNLVAHSEFTADQRSKALRQLIASFNIEDIFPNRAWGEQSGPSAAAAYHTLAAHFIKLGEPDSALECLTLSDQLDDSPRSCALKGLIALVKGEALTAVANMVSSLQQYEIRKRSLDEQCISVQPEDMATINRKLDLGLKALNQRDNSTAFSHFAEAVFCFDSFYRECGVDALKRAAH